MRRVITTTVLSCGALLAVLALFSAPALAQSPWWHLNSSARPTNLHYEPQAQPSQGEVQDVTVTGGKVFVLANVTPAEVANEKAYEPNSNGELKYAEIAVGAEAKVVQQALEAGGLYGPGNVEVSELVPGAAQVGLEPYRVTFKGALAERPVELIDAEVNNNGFRSNRAYGATVGVTQVTAGQGPQVDGRIVASVLNVGDANTSTTGANGEPTPTQIVDKLPAGVRALSVEGVMEAGSVHTPLECSLESMNAGEPLAAVCKLTSGVVLPFDLVEVRVAVFVEESARTGELNEVSVSGGGAPAASIRQGIVVSDEPTPFGVEDYELTPEEEGGTIDTQAGSHPFQTTFTVDLNQAAQTTSGGQIAALPAGGMAKDVHDRFPPGLIGNPKPLEECSEKQFLASKNECPAGSVVGVAVVTFTELRFIGTATSSSPVYSLEPSAGEPARFGFLVYGNENPVYLDTSVRTGEDYGISVDANNITQKIEFLSNYITIWGVPGDPRHDSTRGNNCLASGEPSNYPEPCEPLGEHNPPPFFELPTSCTGQLQTSVEADSWEDPGNYVTTVDGSTPALDGCDRLPFEPSIQVAPDVQVGSSPSGVEVDVKIPQEVSLNGTGLGEADVRDTTVALPAGVTVNPGGVDGLQACSEALIGYLPGESTPPEDLHFTGEVPGRDGSSEPFEPGVDFCSNASKIGTVRIKTPILPNELTGAVYLASQNANPFGSLLALYVVAEDPVSGVLLKLPGEIALCQGAGETVAGMTCEGAGQIVTTLLNTPQAPFEEAEFHFFGGERAPLATPAHCGSYTTSTSISPWSGNEASHPSSTFAIDAGPNGTPCPGQSLPFDPSATGGATDIQAGEYSPFTFTMSRQNGEQNLQSGEVKLPLGVSGMLSNVELCPEPQANTGTCGPGSLIGETTVSIGVGSEPYTVTGGKIYLTGPYNGQGACTPGTPGCAPFGLSIVNPAKAGPFDLERNTANPAGEDACDCVLVRAKIEVNPETAALTILSDPPGSPDAIPTSIEGIPLEIQHVNVTTTRSAFQFNPTNCSKMQAIGHLFSAEGAQDTISVPFQVTNCAALKFQPQFSVSTSGKTSRLNGASLTAKLTYPNVPRGTDADIARVKVELPKALPSRLTTLQKACGQIQFRTDPAGCPAASIIGHARAVVPNIPVALQGPVYFVSNGNEAFPNLVVVLQGYNVTIDLVGDTYISKTGVTSTTFKTVPDNPVNTFEITLPEGKYSALTANTNLCKAKKLTIPTEFVGQNGAEIHQTTKITVTGCPKKKKPLAHKRKAHKRKAEHRKAGRGGKARGKRR
jgi:hypothetical protein